jgi:hypothetical protein
LFTSRRHRVKGNKRIYGGWRGGGGTCPHALVFKHSTQKRHSSGDYSVVGFLSPFMIGQYTG